MNVIPRRVFAFVAASVLVWSLAACVEPPGEGPVPLPLDNDETSSADGDGDGGNGDGPTGDGDGDGPTGDGDGDSESGAVDGAPCQEASDCAGGICLTGASWQGGHCTSSCATQFDCTSNVSENGCMEHPSEGAICVRFCDTSGADTCRDGYRCQSITADQGWCGPDPGTDSDITFSFDCAPASNDTVELDYAIAPSTYSYQIMPFASTNSWISPRHITTPDGSLIDFTGANFFQVSPLSEVGFNPTIVPGAPQFQDQLQSGSHTYTLATGASEVCYYLYQATDPGSVVDINFYFVGVDGLSASNAANHNQFQSMITSMGHYYGQVGLSIGEKRYFDVSQQVTDNFRVLDSHEELAELLTYSEEPGPDLDSTMSVNLFLVEQITYGALGSSMGAPGAVGIHESWLSGVVMSTEYLDQGPQGITVSAVTAAHEVGHFLGLNHTSETDGQTFDALSDTPQCPNINLSNPANCPDWGNLMFPMADTGNTALSDGQGFVLKANPLTK